MPISLEHCGTPPPPLSAARSVEVPVRGAALKANPRFQAACSLADGAVSCRSARGCGRRFWQQPAPAVEKFVHDRDRVQVPSPPVAKAAGLA